MPNRHSPSSVSPPHIPSRLSVNNSVRRTGLIRDGFGARNPVTPAMLLGHCRHVASLNYAFSDRVCSNDRRNIQGDFCQCKCFGRDLGLEYMYLYKPDRKPSRPFRYDVMLDGSEPDGKDPVLVSVDEEDSCFHRRLAARATGSIMCNKTMPMAYGKVYATAKINGNWSLDIETSDGVVRTNGIYEVTVWAGDVADRHHIEEMRLSIVSICPHQHWVCLYFVAPKFSCRFSSRSVSDRAAFHCVLRKLLFERYSGLSSLCTKTAERKEKRTCMKHRKELRTKYEKICSNKSSGRTSLWTTCTLAILI